MLAGKLGNAFSVSMVECCPKALSVGALLEESRFSGILVWLWEDTVYGAYLCSKVQFSTYGQEVLICRTWQSFHLLCTVICVAVVGCGYSHGVLSSVVAVRHERFGDGERQATN